MESCFPREFEANPIETLIKPNVNRSIVWTTNRGGRRTSRVRLSFNRSAFNGD